MPRVLDESLTLSLRTGQTAANCSMAWKQPLGMHGHPGLIVEFWRYEQCQQTADNDDWHQHQRLGIDRVCNSATWVWHLSPFLMVLSQLTYGFGAFAVAGILTSNVLRIVRLCIRAFDDDTVR